MGAVSCSSTSPGGYRAAGFVSHSLVWLSMALHTSLVRAWWAAKDGTARRRRWHAGSECMSCGAAAVIHLHAVPGTITPHSTVPMPSAWSSAWPWTRGKYGLGRPLSSLHCTQAAPACRLRSRATTGRSGCGKAPLTVWAAWARVPMGKYHTGRTQGPGSGCAPPRVPSPLGVWRGGRDRARLQEVACPLDGVPLKGCREAEPLCRGCHWEAAPWPAPGEILAGRPGVEVPGDFLRGSCGGVLRCQVHMTARLAHVEKGHARGGVYTWMVHCGRARRTRDAWSTPGSMSAARTSTIPGGSTMIPSAGPPWRPRVCKATSAWPVWATRSTASWMFTLPRVVSSRIQPCITP